MWTRGLIVFFILIPASALAQMPHWATKVPPGYLNDYYVGSGTANNTSDAYNIAVNNGLTQISYQLNEVQISSITKQRLDDQFSIQIENGKRIVTGKSTSSLEEDVILETNGRLPSGTKVEEIYFSKSAGVYNCFILLSKPKTNPTSPPSKALYSAASFIAPGTGQFIKDQNKKGFYFLGATAATVSSYFIFNYLQNEASLKAREATRQVTRTYYNDRTKKMSNLKNISLVSLSAVYIWNVLDVLIDEPDFYVSAGTNQEKGYWASISYEIRF